MHTVEQVQERSATWWPAICGLAHRPSVAERGDAALHEPRVADVDQRWRRFDSAHRALGPRDSGEKILHYPIGRDSTPTIRNVGVARELGLQARRGGRWSPWMVRSGELIGWSAPRSWIRGHAQLTSIAGYDAQALYRTYYAQHRHEVASSAQTVTTLPAGRG